MARFTVRLPDTLHEQLAELAQREGVSLNQYIVYALSRQTALPYSVQPVPKSSISRQGSEYAALLQHLGNVSFREIQEVLAERDEVEPEVGLKPEVIARLQERINKQQPVW